jgi:hypothetical protein
MTKALDTGRSFLAGVLAKIPESARAQVEAVFQSPDAEAAVTLLGDGVLARTDYSKNMDEIAQQRQELTAKFTELNDWYAVNQPALEEYKVLKAQQGQPPSPPPPPTAPPQSLTAADITKIVEQTLGSREQDYVGLLAFTNTMVGRHYATFGEALDVNELVANPKVGRPIAGHPGRVYSLQDAYNEKYGERVQAKQQEAEAARINKLVEERLVEERKKFPQQVFPIRQEIAPIDTVLTKDGSAAHTLDSAVSLYEQLQANRS